MNVGDTSGVGGTGTVCARPYEPECVYILRKSVEASVWVGVRVYQERGCARVVLVACSAAVRKRELWRDRECVS